MKKVSLMLITFVMLLAVLSCDSGTSNKGNEEEENKGFPAPEILRINTTETTYAIIIVPVPSATNYNIYVKEERTQQIKQINNINTQGINDAGNYYFGINKSEITDAFSGIVGPRRIGVSAISVNGAISEITWTEPNF